MGTHTALTKDLDRCSHLLMAEGSSPTVLQDQDDSVQCPALTESFSSLKMLQKESATCLS